MTIERNSSEPKCVFERNILVIFITEVYKIELGFQRFWRIFNVYK